MYSYKLAIGMILVMVLLFGCVEEPPGPGPSPPSNITGTEPGGDNQSANVTPSLPDDNSVAEGNNRFASDLYSELKEEQGNVFFSPFSISTALAMTYEGARGQTAREMSDVLHLPENSSLRRNGYATLLSCMNSSESELKAANDLWIQKDKPLSESYMQTIRDYYGGNATTLDFMGDPAGSRLAINSRVEQQTNGRIKDLIGPDFITWDTRLILTNAIYFKGKWATPFNSNLTEEEEFTLSSGSKTKVDMMHATDSFLYSESDGIQILEMPYSDGNLSMLVLLPKEGELDELEDSLTAENLKKWKQGLARQEVSVYMPKFKFETGFDLGDTLKGMGMKQAFSGSADFSGITEAEQLMISKVVHKAFVEVNEEGTEAAAATAVGMVLTSAPLQPVEIPEFRADHPFIFLIQEKNSESILFMGRVSDPTAG